ncbi:MBL fold metallo-hydrolase [Bacillus alkalicellulosilyticus]|uniref:MBL fold metallo-hydrolase n=1 Tax=Alkalihalobacterium alkalicellulosilyticum TaxID=1912214 RepID=UPI0014832342|nr:MBL fold metallo-hydrolase [Bacillus alkalicellulosilyticus]
MVGPVNVYLIRGESLTLVDAGPKTKEAWESFIQQLNEIGYGPEDIEQIVITHHHPDHIGMLDYFNGKPTIIGHEKNIPWMSKNQEFLARTVEFYSEFYQQHGISQQNILKLQRVLAGYLDFSCYQQLDKIVKTGDSIDGLDGWQVIEVPGHAQTHIMLVHNESSTVIAGDHLLANVSSNALIEAPYEANEERPKTLLQYRESLHKLRDIQPTLILSGHGPSIHNGINVIQKRLEEQEKRAHHILSLLNEGRKNTVELCEILFPSIYKKQLDLTISEVVGHLDLLEMYEKVNVVIEKNQFFYTAKK